MTLAQKEWKSLCNNILEKTKVKLCLLIQSRAATATAKSLQSCPTLCDPIDGSPPGSAIPGFLQARTLEWVAISFFNAWKWKVKGKSLSHVRLFATPWTAAHQASPSVGFSRQEYWGGVPSPSPAGTWEANNNQKVAWWVWNSGSQLGILQQSHLSEDLSTEVSATTYMHSWKTSLSAKSCTKSDSAYGKKKI